MESSGALSDIELLDDVARRVAVPREEPGDSFVLHAPLEALARVGLLGHVASIHRDPIVDRLREVGSAYEAWGEPFDHRPTHGRAIEQDAAGVLVAAVASGDLEAADDAITWLVDRLDADELVHTLAGPVLPSLAAAAHGSILLFLLPRIAARSMDAASMARTTVHELVRRPDWQLRWFASPRADQAPDPASELERRLTAPRLPEQPENTFIHPTMSTTERTGLAADTLGDLVDELTVADARRVLLRTAARSMLQDDPDHAPYGWSHCLTMPQAALGVAPAAPTVRTAIAVAATYVLGFRASLGSVALDHEWAPDPLVVPVRELVEAGRTAAAASAWHASPAERPEIWRRLAANAGAHRDAHLAKYTLACMDAARADRAAEHLFIAAAASLNGWWHDADRPDAA
ncbi:MAG: hypothetical protein QNJ12_08845 [Ilumatobacter sp.]|uniref:hypothetical protein n=1 Tax=Ilumatobacter sp. TaxID=1967498 RepID=UPI0026395B73|nr:hypothetical protein [Ilumatobacter sp.]MDJ0768888.1 hypothetical protein [Ilumatobacter sp.]